VDAATCPCLIAAGSLPLPLERVMAPVDLSEAAAGSLAVALTWASALRRPDRESELAVLHVVTGEENPTPALDGVVERLRAWAGGVARVRVRVLRVESADPAGEILRRATSDSADLLVMGTGTAAAGRESTERRVGRVSSAVIRATPRPILLVPPPVWRRQDGE
jgi:nucleotide-binding universal stress UspA family protein